MPRPRTCRLTAAIHSFARRVLRPARLALSLRALALVCSWCAALGAGPASAQNIQQTSKAADLNLRSNLTVNPATLALEFQLTLGSYPGRGLSVPVTLNYSSKVWRVAYESYTPSVQVTFDGQTLQGFTSVAALYSGGWTSGVGFPVIDHSEESTRYNLSGMPLPETTDCDHSPCYRVDRVMIRMPDNSTHELRSSDQPYTVGNGYSPPSPVPDDLYAVDGSRLRYQRSTQTLFLPDGSHYVMDSAAPRYVDRNGNTILYNAASIFNINNNIEVGLTDTLGRSIPPPLPLAPPAGDRVYTLPGVGNSSLPYTLKYKRLGDTGVMTGGETVHYVADLGPPPQAGGGPTAGGTPNLFVSGADTYISSAADVFNPVVLHKIILPDERAYTFNYNAYGEITKVTLPGGGYERYAYGSIPTLSVTSSLYAQANRGVTRRYVSASGAAADEAEWQYAYAGTYPYGSGTQGHYVVSITAPGPDGTLTERYLHTDSLLGGFGFDVDQGKAGMAYDERHKSAPDGANQRQLLGRKLTKWATTGSNATGFAAAQQGARRNGRVEKEVELVLGTNGGPALAKVTTYEYDLTYEFTTGATLKAVNEYDYFAVSQSSAQTGDVDSFPTPAQWLRRTEYDYLDASNAAYRDRNLLGLKKETRVKDASGAVVARTEVRYDEPDYYLPSYGPVTGWADPPTLARGNPTTVRSYAAAASAVAPASACPAGVCVDTHTEYDRPGSVTGSWDANGNKTAITYSPAHAYAYPTSVTTEAPNPAPVPNPDGGKAYAAGTFGSTSGFTSRTEYDPDTGLVTATLDANGGRTTYEYTDPLNRLKVVTRPDDGTTTYDYGQANNAGKVRDYVRTATALASGRSVVSYQFSDGLGRPDRSFLSEGGSPEVYLTSDTRYDTSGRVWKVSNPHRTAGWGQSVNPSGLWTTTEYDALGRIKKVTTPDGAAVTTAYSGSRVTVTDQAGRKRRSVSDALGRLVRVDEPDKASGALDDSGGNPVQPTHYTYDALGNLRKVDQGGQKRFFMYDSLGRLIRARNPEQATHDRLTHTDALNDALTGNSLWSVGYGYDPNGNLITRVDARNVETTYAYDRLNRNILASYSGGTPDTPTALYRYDSGVKGKGLPYLTQQSGSVTSATYFDEYDVMGRPLVMRQKFETAGVWSLDYRVTRAYDLAGNVTSQTYPSGHTVTYNYDAAGRTSAFTGGLGDGVERTYADQVTYGEFGGLRQERFGTHTPLYRKLHYNRRGQLYDIRLSTRSLQSGEWDWNRGAIVNYYSSNYAWEGNPSTPAGNDNNGNLLMQQQSVPRDDSISDTNLNEQKYEYDALNRLKSVAEQKRDCEACPRVSTFTQAYSYDRWGNRTINAGETKVHEQNVPYSVPEPQFSVDPNTNRLGVPPGQSGQMNYDAAGNLINDSYSPGSYGSTTGQQTRFYDAESRMTAAPGTDGNTAHYTYDPDGQRVRRKVAGEEWWQVYGVGGELLAEYRAGAAAYLPTKEYGYRGGELLVTMSSGDDQRLRRFVQNLYYGALRRDATAQELQAKTNELAAAGVQGQAQLFQKAKEVARALFTQTSYETSPHRTEGQYVADLYYAYLQRAPDDGGLGHWTGAAGGGVTNRANVCDAFQESPEFAAVASTLYGSAASDDERTELFVNRFYLGAYGVAATPAQLQQRRAELNTAATQGANAVKSAAEAMGRQLFAAQVTDLSLPAQQFVTNLYEGFLQRGPDAQGLANWTAAAGATAQGRQSVLNAFATCDPFRELSGTLYRETFWLVSDQLGTPRMVVDRTGSLAGVKRHDYLPFGENLSAGTGGRTTAQGYGAVDNVRQKFTGYEKDGETGLNYAQNRYYAPSQGRFISVDPANAGANEGDPQSWNGYSYAGNSPLKYVDPLGLWKQVECSGGATQCWQAEEGDTWGSLAWDAGIGYGPTTAPYVAAFFQSEVTAEITEGTVVDISGFTKWKKGLDGHTRIELDLSVQYDVGFGGGLRTVGPKAARAGGGLLSRFWSWLRGGGSRGPTFAGGITREALERAAADPGPTVQVVTRLTHAPQPGRALSVAVGENAGALANAARSGGQVFTANIPKALIETLRTAGLVRQSVTHMGGTTAVEYRFEAEAAEFILRYFK